MQSYLISFKKSKVLNFLDLPHFLSSFKNQLPQKYQTPPGHTANWNRIFFFSISSSGLLDDLIMYHFTLDDFDTWLAKKLEFLCCGNER